MDYKQKYEEALEKARVWKEKSGMPIDRQGILDDIFPELKESEDEKIRKEILSYLKSSGDIINQRWIAWLEKQGEQKPTWSEEDESLSQEITNDIKIAYERAHIEQLKDIYSKQINWIKSLKERIKGE